MPRRNPNNPFPDDKPKKGGLTSGWKRAKGLDATPLADWSRADPVLVQSLVVTVTDGGGALLLGYSRDRGAYRVIIMDDDDKVTEWIPGNTDLDEALNYMIALLTPERYSNASDAQQGT